jgi:DNA-binding transcriptional LysR family regulator
LLATRRILVKNKKNLGCQLKNLPPLNALRAFEVAARTGSFVQAGVELGVTAAAVSLQVKTLEEHLDKRLFQREGNRIVLTDAGRELYPRLGQALSEIAELAADLRGGQDRKRLVVSVLPSLADLWLVPKLRNCHILRDFSHASETGRAFGAASP